MGALLRSVAFLAILAIGAWAGYGVFQMGFWMDGTQAVIASAVSAIVALVVIFATIDYWILRM